MEDFVGSHSRGISRVCAGGFRPILMGVLWQVMAETISPNIVAEMERGLGVETT